MTPSPEEEKEIVFVEPGDNQQEKPREDDDETPPASAFERPMKRGILRSSSRHQAFFHNNDLGLHPGEEGFDEDQAALPFVLNEWASSTSIHGVAFIADGLTWQWWKRFLWMVLVCCSGGLMIWQITTLIKQYNELEIVTDTTTVTPDTMEFPEITLCNMNYESQTKMDATGIYNPRNEAEVHAIGRSLEEFIDFTYFNDIENDLTQVWSPIVTHWGLCFQFNATNKTVVRPGLFGGLSFSVYLNQADNGGWRAHEGIILYAQHPGTQINDQLPFLVISPGTDAIVNLQKEEFERERKLPWSRCEEESGYTQSSCRAKCVMEQMITQCGCREFGDFTYNNETMPALDYCGSGLEDSDEDSGLDDWDDDDDNDNGDDFNEDSYDDHIGCWQKVWDSEREFLPLCPCSLPPCNEDIYTMTVNELKLSKDEQLHLLNISETLDDFIEVVINYNEMKYDKLKESIAISRSSLLGSIGGSMGLFLGISFLSLVEVFGDLIPLRLLPRMFGYRNIHGVGSRPAEP